MNSLDFAVLLVVVLGIALYGVWQTKNHSGLRAYLKGRSQPPWWAIGLSVMATQASAITFLSTPGQGYLSGISFLQVYFGVPLALILIAVVIIPLFHRLNVFTAYEYLEKRFDRKTRLFGAALFLLQRGIGAGLTIYAPAIVLSSVFTWSLEGTIIAAGLLVTWYTVIGGTDAVTITQKWQLSIIFVGMLAAFFILISKLPAELAFVDALHLAGRFQRLDAVNLSPDLNERYTLWSGVFGGTVLMLSYFGADQSQVQRYISGSSIRESKLGLLFNAVCKIPMQFFILMLGVLMFIHYQFQPPPLFFDAASTKFLELNKTGASHLGSFEEAFHSSHLKERESLNTWIAERRKGNFAEADKALQGAVAEQSRAEAVRVAAVEELKKLAPGIKANNADYVFISFILKELPHGLIGLLVAAFFMAALSSKAAELNALGTSSTIDFYKTIINPGASDKECLKATKMFTAFWGLVAVGIALYAQLSENLIQAVNILGSIFYGVLLSLFVIGFFLRRISGNAVFVSAILAQAVVFLCHFGTKISYLWYPLIGCVACIMFSLALQPLLGRKLGVVES